MSLHSGRGVTSRLKFSRNELRAMHLTKEPEKQSRSKPGSYVIHSAEGHKQSLASVTNGGRGGGGREISDIIRLLLM